MSVDHSPPRATHSRTYLGRARAARVVHGVEPDSCAARRARAAHPARHAAERARDHRRREPRRSARHHRGGRAERLVHAVADVRGAVAPVRAHVLQGERCPIRSRTRSSPARRSSARCSTRTHAGRAGELLPHRAVGQHRCPRSRCSRRRCGRRSFCKDELERERAVVIGEYDRIESDPFYALNTATGKALWGSAWSRKNPLGERDVILQDDARADAHDPAQVLRAEQHGDHRHRRRRRRQGVRRRATLLRRLAARRRSVQVRSDSAGAAAHREQGRHRRAAGEHGDRRDPVARSGCARRPRRHLRGRRVLRRAQPAGLTLPASARRQRSVAVDRS